MKLRDHHANLVDKTVEVDVSSHADTASDLSSFLFCVDDVLKIGVAELANSLWQWETQPDITYSLPDIAPDVDRSIAHSLLSELLQVQGLALNTLWVCVSMFWSPSMWV